MHQSFAYSLHAIKPKLTDDQSMEQPGSSGMQHCDGQMGKEEEVRGSEREDREEESGESRSQEGESRSADEAVGLMEGRSDQEEEEEDDDEDGSGYYEEEEGGESCDQSLCHVTSMTSVYSCDLCELALALFM